MDGSRTPAAPVAEEVAMIRLFVAVPLPERIKERLALMQQGIPGAKWMAPENFHITLRFIGEVTEDLAEDIDGELAGIRAPAFDLELASVGHFGHLQKARLLWVGVERNPALQHLRDKVDRALVRAGLAPADRKFTPHVSLARIKGETGHHLANFLAEHSTFRSEPIPVRSFGLVASYLKATGAVHETVADYVLSEPVAA